MTDAAVFEMRWEPTPRRRWSTTRLAVAGSLHLLAVLALWFTADHVELPVRHREVWTTLVDAANEPRVPPAAAATPPTPRAALAGHARPSRHDTPAPLAPTSVPAPELPQMAPSPAADAASPPPEAARASAPRGSILDTDASRQAIREAMHAPLLAERAASATGIALPAGAGERLADHVDAAHKGDCTKGEYDHFIFSQLAAIPMLALAELRGKCAK